MTTTIITFPVSGKAMSTIEGSELYSRPQMYDGGTQGAHDACNALQHARGRRAGKGWTYTVETTVAGAEIIEEYCQTVGETFAGDSEPDNRADGRALLKVADRIRQELKAAK